MARRLICVLNDYCGISYDCVILALLEIASGLPALLPPVQVLATRRAPYTPAA